MPDTLPVATRQPMNISIQPEVNEAVIVRENVISPDALAPPPDGGNQESDQVFSHAHKDELEYSGTLEQARRVCPVLGRMSLENARSTLQDAELAARVAQRGREKRQVEAAKAIADNVSPALFINNGNDRKRTPTNQKEFDQASSSDSPAAPAYIPPGPMLETGHGDAASIELANTWQSEFTHLQPTAPEFAGVIIHHGVTGRLAQYADKIGDGPVGIIARTSRIAFDLGHVAQEIHLSAVTHDSIGSETVKPFVDTVRRASESIASAAVGPTHSQDAHREFVAKNFVSRSAQLTALEQVSPESQVPETAQPEILGCYEEPFIAITEQQVDILPMPPVAMQESAELRPDNVSATALSESIILSPAPTESHSVVPDAGLPAAAEAIETAMRQLTAVAEVAVGDTTQEVYKILEEMLVLPATISTSIEEAETVAVQRLAAFLLDPSYKDGVSYLPGPAESFGKRTPPRHFYTLLTKGMAATDAVPMTPAEIGTREFLQKLQHGLSAMKQSALYFYQIGRSVLRLYA